jgi:hypothetical protein
MATRNANDELEDVEVGEPLLVSQTDDETDAAIDEEELRRHITSSKTAKRWRYIRFVTGAFVIFVFVGVFVRLSRWKRPFDCMLSRSTTLPLRVKSDSCKVKRNLHQGSN